MKTKEKKFISVTEYARRHRITRQGVLKRIAVGRIKAVRVGNYYAIKV